MGKSVKPTEILVTVADWVRWGTSEFNRAGLHFGHGSDNAWDEALHLVLHALHLTHDCSPDVYHAKLLPEERERVYAVLQERLVNRIPAAYLTKRARFAGIDFYVDKRVIIPRSPIAELLEHRFAPWWPDEKPAQRILDLCTGSGCLAIAIAYAFPEADIDAVDIDTDALAVARVNVDNCQLEQRLQLIQSDVFDAVANSRYDIIISNPPYVSDEEYQQLPQEYQHEPKHSLLAEEEGLAIVARILTQAKQHLNPGGLLIVEVGNSQQELLQRYPTLPFVWPEFKRGGSGVFILTAEQLNDDR